MLGHRLDVRRRKPPAGAQPDMQVHLGEDRRHARLRRPQVDERAALIGGEPISPGELDQEQIVLHQISAEGGGWQRAGAELAHEGMVDVALPVGARRVLQPVEDVHRTSPWAFVAAEGQPSVTR